MPIRPEIKYYLDNKEVEAEDIVGQSGKLKITIKVDNKDKRSIKLKNGEGKTGYAPYMVATVVDLPMDKFNNIKINTGKILSDCLEITADVVDFEMKPIVFTVTSEIPEIDGLEELSAGSDNYMVASLNYRKGPMN